MTRAKKTTYLHASGKIMLKENNTMKKAPVIIVKKRARARWHTLDSKRERLGTMFIEVYPEGSAWNL